MNITIVSASPKKRFSTSLYFSKILKFFLMGNTVKIINLSSVRQYTELLSQLPKTDVLVFTFPIYVDAIPSTVLEYLHKLQKDISEKNYAFKVYGINICGFYEGHQCHLTLDMLENWCIRTNLKWCGGIGIGAGEMLNFQRLVVPVSIITTLIDLFINALLHASKNQFSNIFNNFLPENLIPILLTSSINSAIVAIIFSLGMFIGLFRMKTHIVRKKTYKNIFTTVWFCPRFLFVYLASVYWILRALICHRVLVWSLFRRIDVAKKNIFI